MLDLRKVDAEITALRSTLAAIDNDLDECRQRYPQHPWAWSQIRRTVSFERYRLQRRLEEFIFTRKCARGRTRESVPLLSFRSLASPDEQNTEQSVHQPDPPTLLASNFAIKEPDHIVTIVSPMEQDPHHTGRLVLLATRWDELNHHVQASGQLVLPF
jgi:hypothetical protein